MKPNRMLRKIVVGVGLSGVALICCAAPVAAIALGTQGVPDAFRIAEGYPYFLAAGAGLLAMAWLLIFRSTQSVNAAGDGARATAGILPKVAFWTGTALSLPAASVSWLASSGRLCVGESCAQTGASAVACSDGSCQPATIQPWEPVAKTFAACAGACGTKATKESGDVAVQPGVMIDQQTYCPVSGVVFRVTAASPQRALGSTQLRFCCEGCAAYFSANQERVSIARGLSPGKTSG